MISDAGIRRALGYILFGLSSLAGGTTAYAQGQQNCALNVLAGLDMHTLPDGGISIPVKVEDRDSFFEIDTGGLVSTIDPHVADAMKMRTGVSATTMVGIANAHSNITVFPKSFSIGKLTTKDLFFFRSPFSTRGTGGTIAPEILRNYDIDLDFAGGKFNLISPDHCPGRVLYWTHGAAAIVPMTVTSNDGHMHIPVKIDGKPMEATIDTGASVSVMSATAARRFLDIDESSAGMTPLTERMNGAPLKSYSYPFKSIDFEGISVENPYILILQDSDMRRLGTDLILGTSTLRQLHIYIAYKEGKMYLTAATAH